MKDKAFSEILLILTGGNNPVLTVSETARVMGVSENTVYDYRQDRTEPSYSKIKALAKELDRRDCYILALQFLPAISEGSANGCLDDESGAMIKLIGKLYTAHKGKTKAEFFRIIELMKSVVDDFKREGDLL